MVNGVSDRRQSMLWTQILGWAKGRAQLRVGGSAAFHQGMTFPDRCGNNEGTIHHLKKRSDVLHPKTVYARIDG